MIGVIPPQCTGPPPVGRTTPAAATRVQRAFLPPNSLPLVPHQLYPNRNAIIVGTRPAYESDDDVDEDGLVRSPTRTNMPDIFLRAVDRPTGPPAAPAPAGGGGRRRATTSPTATSPSPTAGPSRHAPRMQRTEDADVEMELN